MKKKLKDTKIGKILKSPLITNLIGLVPIVGKPIGDTLKDTQKSPQGTRSAEDKQEFTGELKGVLKLIITAIIVIALLRGCVDPETAQDATDILNSVQ